MVKNFILFNPDELRADALGCYGNPAAHTPNLDKLAEEAVRFEQCHVQHTVCTPSRCSFITGLYPHNSGKRTLWNVIGEDEPHLFQYLCDAGYEIHWWGKNDMLSQNAAIKCLKSIDVIPDSILKECTEWEAHPICKPDGKFYDSFLFESNTSSIHKHPDFVNVRGAIEFLKSKPEKPFCLYLPLFFPHPPYCTTKDFKDIVDKDKIPSLRPVVERGKPGFYNLIRKYRGLDRLNEDDFREIRKVYLEQTAMIDYMVGEIIRTLNDTGLAENTAFLFFSDHGDWAGDYGLVEKWPSGLDDTLTRVPFIIKTPDCKKGHVVKEPIEMFDMMATVMELAGIKAKHTNFARSLVPQLRGVAGDPDRAVFTEGGYDVHEPHCFEGSGLKYDISLQNSTGNIYYKKGLQQQEHPDSVCRSVMIRTKEFKLVIRTNWENEFYDLKLDPQELSNQYNSEAYKDIIAGLEDRLLQWYIRTSDTVPFERQPRHFFNDTKSKINGQI